MKPAVLRATFRPTLMYAVLRSVSASALFASSVAGAGGVAGFVGVIFLVFLLLGMAPPQGVSGSMGQASPATSERDCSLPDTATVRRVTRRSQPNSPLAAVVGMAGPTASPAAVKRT